MGFGALRDGIGEGRWQRKHYRFHRCHHRTDAKFRIALFLITSNDIIIGVKLNLIFCHRSIALRCDSICFNLLQLSICWKMCHWRTPKRTMEVNFVAFIEAFEFRLSSKASWIKLEI